mgnify:FL=1
MNDTPAPLPPASPPTAAGHAHTSSASARLESNRQRLSGWLEQDRRAHASYGWVAAAALPVLKSLGTHPVASLALGALAQGWMRDSPATLPGPPLETQALGAALAVVRRHPKTSLAVVALAGAALLWSGWRRSSPP